MNDKTTGTGWVQVADDRVRCSECGSMTDSSWRYFVKQGSWTLAFCEPCVNSKLTIEGGS